ncbi:hypothetical protein AS149_28250 [Burkholderia cenocepacia]|nr:hypothetical protein AS149_28250 [Burkholderia cenocepacia]
MASFCGADGPRHDGRTDSKFFSGDSELAEFIGIAPSSTFTKRRSRLLDKTFELFAILPDDLESVLKVRESV